ncbi:MAG: metal-dependent hydrolase [Ignavibacteriales bacterium]|nr:MAG: metal-dependent hydrolase [Ignavibacteriales bacterium]
MKLKYFGHSAFQITTSSNQIILIDPFIDNNPNCPVKSKDLNADYIILSHGHGDHIGDAFKIADKDRTIFICVNELANYCIDKGFKAHNMHIGGSFNFDFGKVKFTIAHHGSMTPDGTYGGEPAGIILNIEGKNIYHTGDTGLFYDMKLIGEITPINYMLLPIGDNYTMGITDASKAVEFVNPEVAIPMHYNTFPEIKADPNEFKSIIEKAGFKCIIMNYGEELTI